MAILHRKEEKIQVVLGRLPKEYTHEEFVEMFIKLYSKDWGKIKSAYIKQNQDKEPGTVVNMPKPDLYLRQVLDTYLAAKSAEVPVKETEVTLDVNEKAVAKATKASVKKKEDPEVSLKETKAGSKKKAADEKAPLKTKKIKTT